MMEASRSCLEGSGQGSDLSQRPVAGCAEPAQAWPLAADHRFAVAPSSDETFRSEI